MRRVHQMIETARHQRVFQSACLLVGDAGQPVVHQAYGPASLDSRFDLASLTKPLATGLALMRLVSEGRLSTEQPLGEVLPVSSRRPLSRCPLWMLLAHCSGLPAWRPFYASANGLSFARMRRRVRQQILLENPAYEPGSESRYSDLGFILLGWIVERTTQRRLDRHLRDSVYRPLRVGLDFVDLMATRASLPTTAGSAARSAPAGKFVPTERCPRRGRLCGQVHDDNAHAMGGIAGHAGLFGSAHDVHVLLRELVSAFHLGRSLFAPEVVRAFWRAQPVAASSWALGWDRPCGPRSSAGRRARPSCVGHLGFTGTSVWLDPELARWVILLTNRVYYGREPNRLKPLRPRLHDAIWRALETRRTASSSR